MKRFLPKMMSEAAALVSHGDLMRATTLIQKMLGNVPVPAGRRPARKKPVIGVLTATRSDDVTDVVVDVDTDPIREAPEVDRVAPVPGFHDAVLPGAGTTKRYKVFVPSRPASRPSLIVLLHGCTQDPDDFAAGTAMNERAERGGFYVLYPAQSAAANPSRCWNWFRREDQQRGAGEPAAIVAMTLATIDRYGIDPARVAIAGLSAGGGMAAIVATQYPDVYSAVGVHSGLPAGAATNLPDALNAMRTGRSRAAARSANDATATAAVARRVVPMIVFHGDADSTVHPDNAQALVDGALQTVPGGASMAPTVDDGTSRGGRRYTRSRYADKQGDPVVESWLLHGGTHAWSGGDRKGTYTDPDGPSATDEMLRFFDERVRRADVVASRGW